MIELLQAFKEKHGDTEVFFDCPKCGLAMTPTKLAEVAKFETTNVRV